MAEAKPFQLQDARRDDEHDCHECSGRAIAFGSLCQDCIDYNDMSDDVPHCWSCGVELETDKFDEGVCGDCTEDEDEIG